MKHTFPSALSSLVAILSQWALAVVTLSCQHSALIFVFRNLVRRHLNLMRYLRFFFSVRNNSFCCKTIVYGEVWQIGSSSPDGGSVFSNVIVSHPSIQPWLIRQLILIRAILVHIYISAGLKCMFNTSGCPNDWFQLKCVRAYYFKLSEICWTEKNTQVVQLFMK